MREKLLQWVCCPLCHSSLELNDPAFCESDTILSGHLFCLGCQRQYPIVDGIPWLLDQELLQGRKNVSNKTARRYEFLWKHSKSGCGSGGQCHVQRVLSWLGDGLFEGRIGLDAGSGMGDDTEYLARQYPHLEILSLDISLGIVQTQQRVKRYPNVHVIRASVLQLPLKDRLIDIVYSYGVLHHTPNPGGGFNEFARIIKPKGRVILYSYEDHSDHKLKRIAVKGAGFVRRLTVQLSPRILYFLSWVFSPWVVILFSWPAYLLSRFPKTQPIAEKIPFNFGRGLWSVTGDLYDRFSVPYEFRFSAEQIERWYQNAKFDEIRVGHLRDIAGLVSTGRKL